MIVSDAHTRYEEDREVLLSAQKRLAAVIGGETLSAVPRLFLALAFLNAIIEYSASSNSIPGLRGLGYEDALKLANAINAAPKITEHTIEVHSYRLGIRGIKVN